MIAIDMSLAGGDDSALVAVGVQDGAAVIVGLHVLKGEVDEASPRSWSSLSATTPTPSGWRRRHMGITSCGA